jgi:hypothetical protein
MKTLTNAITHKATGWTRTSLADGSSCYQITPTDDSGDRIVRFLSRNSYAKDPNDDRANIGTDRVVLISGEALPPWAIEWLTNANIKACQRGRDALQAAIDDADFHADSQDGW